MKKRPIGIQQPEDTDRGGTKITAKLFLVAGDIMRGSSHKFVASWEIEAGHEEKFLAIRGQVAQNSGGISIFEDFHSLASQNHR